MRKLVLFCAVMLGGVAGGQDPGAGSEFFGVVDFEADGQSLGVELLHDANSYHSENADSGDLCTAYWDFEVLQGHGPVGQGEHSCRFEVDVKSNGLTTYTYDDYHVFDFVNTITGPNFSEFMPVTGYGVVTMDVTVTHYYDPPGTDPRDIVTDGFQEQFTLEFYRN